MLVYFEQSESVVGAIERENNSNDGVGVRYTSGSLNWNGEICLKVCRIFLFFSSLVVIPDWEVEGSGSSCFSEHLLSIFIPRFRSNDRVVFVQEGTVLIHSMARGQFCWNDENAILYSREEVAFLCLAGWPTGR